MITTKGMLMDLPVMEISIWLLTVLPAIYYGTMVSFGNIQCLSINQIGPCVLFFARDLHFNRSLGLKRKIASDTSHHTITTLSPSSININLGLNKCRSDCSQG